MNQHQFLEVTKWEKKDLRRFCSEMTLLKGHDDVIPFLLEFRKAIQQACSQYSKTISFDHIQQNAIRLQELILMWCREYFVTWARKELLKDKPYLLFNEQKLKGLSNQIWEEYVKKNSY